MNRAEFQALAELRLTEAETLLAAGLWDGAYYLAGYAVECGLKSCILVRVERGGVLFDPDNKKFSENCLTHNLETLLGLAGLSTARSRDGAVDVTFESNWAVVKDWREVSRYVPPHADAEGRARSLISAITDPRSGVLPWIRQRW